MLGAALSAERFRLSSGVPVKIPRDLRSHLVSPFEQHQPESRSQAWIQPSIAAVKKDHLNQSISQFSFLGRKAAAAFVLATLSTGASIKAGVRSAGSPIVVSVGDSSGGVVDAYRAYETRDRVFVTGRIRRTLGQEIPAPAHVDIQLLAADGTVLAEKRDDIDPGHPRLSRGRSRLYPFVASFSLAEAQGADRIVVRYDSKSHAL